MADLLDSAPADPETPVTPGDGTQPAVTPPADELGEQPGEKPAEPAKPQRKPVDIDATIEEALAAGRQAADDRKAADAAMKAAKELAAKYEPFAKLDPTALARYLAIQEQLTAGQRVAAVRALLEEKVDDDLLYDLAEHAKPKPAPTVDEAVAKALADRDKVAADKKADEEKKASDARAASDAAEVDAWMKRSALALKSDLDKYPWIKAWGCDPDRYKTLTSEWIEKNKAIPEPAQILQLIEDEHIARHRKSPGAPRELAPLDDDLEDLSDKASATYERHRPPGPRTADDGRTLSPTDQARAELDAWDSQQRQRLRWGR